MVGKERILVVDDDEAVRDVVSKTINLLGYEAVATGNGREALGFQNCRYPRASPWHFKISQASLDLHPGVLAIGRI